MKKTGKDLKLGDILYYVDDRFEIREYTIEGMTITQGSTESTYNRTPNKNLWNGIRISFGEQWEKTPLILKDGKGGRNKWNAFNIFIHKQDAIFSLNQEIDKEIGRKNREIENLRQKKII